MQAWQAARDIERAELVEESLRDDARAEYFIGRITAAMRERQGRTDTAHSTEGDVPHESDQS